MNKKVLVEVAVPAAGTKYDVFIPLESRLGEVLKLLSCVLSELSEGKYKASENAVLCDARTGIILDVNIEVAELQIKNGSALMLI